jgi:hypothetical protein
MEAGLFGCPWLLGVNVHIYYASWVNTNQLAVPLTRLRLTFEPQLGDGPEYEDGDSGEQIIYPMYAGVGSPDLDLGTSAQSPNIKFEVQGKFGIYPSGDCDFMDIIEDIVRSGQIQYGYSSSQSLGLLQLGVNCYDYPLVIQAREMGALEQIATSQSFSLGQPLEQGDVIVVMCMGRDPLTNSPFDSVGNVYTLIAEGVLNPLSTYTKWGYTIWYATNVTDQPAGVVVSCNNPDYNQQAQMVVIRGDNLVFDTVSVSAVQNVGVGSPLSGSITTTNDGGKDCAIIAFIAAGIIANTNIAPSGVWQPLLDLRLGVDATSLIRRVTQPGNYPLSGVTAAQGSDYVTVLFSFKSTEPRGTAAALGNIMDEASLQLTRTQCRAYGLTGALSMQSQSACSDWLTPLYAAANAAPVWAGFYLYSFPYAEASKVGNGAIYISPTASGPLDDWSTERGDFETDGNNPPITIERQQQTDFPTIPQMQILNRASDYNQLVVTEPLSADTAVYGPRKDSPVVMDMVKSPTVARKLMKITSRINSGMNRNVYKGSVNASRGSLALPMDLYRWTDPDIGLNKQPVRLLSVVENDRGGFDIEAEKFIYGMRTPDDVVGSNPSPISQGGGDPGSVNVPIFFQPVPRLLTNPTDNELWIVLSGQSLNYGGCFVNVSTTGETGAYNLLKGTNGTPIVIGSGTTGYLTADWPAGTSPDTTHDLLIDLTESNGSLVSYGVSDEDNYTYPCYVSGGTALIPYELMTYSVANLTSPFNYTLKATGGGTNHLDRAVFSAPNPGGVGVDHPLTSPPTSRFAFLSPAGTGIFKVSLDPRWVGIPLWFKFPTVNTFLGSQQDIADCVAYPYTPIASGQGPEYVQTPPFSLANPDSTHIAITDLTEAFQTGVVDYNFTSSIAIPGGAPGTPTWFYVTITDPAQLGGNNLPVNIQTIAQEAATPKNGVNGYIYVGAILCLPAGGGNRATPGGWPAPQGFQVGP